MVAITAVPTAIARPAARPRPLSDGRPRDARPPLRLVPEPGAGAPSRSVFARLVAGVVLALVVVVAAAYLARAEPVPAAGEIPVLDAAHVVAEGETMWSIANQVAPAGEAAAYVERLVEVNGGAAVAPGQEVVLPAP